jgi:hypothetical protein
MYPSIKKLARLVDSFPIYDEVLRYRLAEVEEPAVSSQLRGALRSGRARILAVDLANQRVLIGYMDERNPASRAMIAGRAVVIPK